MLPNDTPQQALQFTFSGGDAPELLRTLLGILAELDLGLLDIAQTTLGEVRTLQVLVDLRADEPRAQNVQRTLAQVAADLGLTVRLLPNLVPATPGDRFAVTLLAPRVTPAQVHATSPVEPPTQ